MENKIKMRKEITINKVYYSEFWQASTDKETLVKIMTRLLDTIVTTFN